MKPRIADLEKQGLKYCCEYDLAKLLRLARAAKASRAMLEEFSGDALPDPNDFARRSARADKALDDALDAIDWDD